MWKGSQTHRELLPDSAALFCHASLYLCIVLVLWPIDCAFFKSGNIVEHWATDESDKENEFWTYIYQVAWNTTLYTGCVRIMFVNSNSHEHLKRWKEPYFLIFMYICMFLFSLDSFYVLSFSLLILVYFSLFMTTGSSRRLEQRCSHLFFKFCRFFVRLALYSDQFVC